MADGEGFEPPEPFLVRLFSKQMLSATQPTIQVCQTLAVGPSSPVIVKTPTQRQENQYVWFQGTSIDGDKSQVEKQICKPPVFLLFAGLRPGLSKGPLGMCPGFRVSSLGLADHADHADHATR